MAQAAYSVTRITLRPHQMAFTEPTASSLTTLANKNNMAAQQMYGTGSVYDSLMRVSVIASKITMPRIYAKILKYLDTVIYLSVLNYGGMTRTLDTSTAHRKMTRPTDQNDALSAPLINEIPTVVIYL